VPASWEQTRRSAGTPREGLDCRDTGRPGGEGQEAIEADGVARARGHALLQRGEEAVVTRIGHEPGRGAARALLLEAAALLDRVDELAEPVRELDAAEVELEALRDGGVVRSWPASAASRRGYSTRKTGRSRRASAGSTRSTKSW
jgi:hypothetical protein